MSTIRMIYLGLAILGAILPMYYFVAWFAEFGWSLGAIIEAWNVNDATTGLVWDLTVSAAALTAWVIHETVRDGRWLNLIAIPAAFCVGVSCGFPLYLFLRSRPSVDPART